MVKMHTPDKASELVFRGSRYLISDGVVEVPDDAVEELKSHGYAVCEGETVKRGRGRPAKETPPKE